MADEIMPGRLLGTSAYFAGAQLRLSANVLLEPLLPGDAKTLHAITHVVGDSDYFGQTIDLHYEMPDGKRRIVTWAPLADAPDPLP